MGKLKVIVLSGFLGSGKTTFIKNVIQFAQNLKIAIILNDVSEFDMDINLVKSKSIKFKKTSDMIEMGGGCVCCTLKDEMIQEVKKIYKTKKYDYLFIEATGISTPLPVAQAFHATEGMLKIVQVYSMITVVDAQNFLINLTSDEIIKEEENVSKKFRRSARIRSIQEKHHLQHHHNQMKDEKQEKATLSQLMISQLQIANVILVNKKDLVTQAQLEKILCYLKSINPKSQILVTSYSKVDLKNLFEVKKFDLQTAQKDQKWITQKEKIEDIPQTIKYNITSFIYEARRPFQPYKFYQLINNKKNYPFWSQITRAKGFFWLANYPKFAFTMQKAGARIYYQLDQPWWCEISKQHWGDTKQQREDTKKFIDKFWDKKVGDKRNQIVFISQDLNRKEIQNKLNSCLIKQQEMDNYEQIYSKIEDPFHGRWKEGINILTQQGILLQNEGDWEEVDEDEEQQFEEEEEQIKDDIPEIRDQRKSQRIKKQIRQN